MGKILSVELVRAMDFGGFERFEEVENPMDIDESTRSDGGLIDVFRDQTFLFVRYWVFIS